MDIEVTRTEAAIGPFAVDILGAVPGSDRVVIIENQIERTDHTHLGQVITYAAGHRAAVAIWVSARVRDQHREAIHWLNEFMGDEIAFFAVEVELLRIAASPPAPRFTVRARPPNFSRLAAPPSERGLAHQSFFVSLIERLRDRHPGFTHTDPERIGYRNWMGFGAGRSGFNLSAVFGGGRLAVALVIQAPGNEARNNAAFDALHAQREEIEGGLDMPLQWERRTGRTQSRIAAYRDEDAPGLVDWAAETLPRFRAAFAPRVAALDLES